MPKERKPLGRGQSLQQALDKIRATDLNVGSMADLGGAESVRAVSTGNVAIDAITGVWGLPRGRIVELYGIPSSGKTTLALQAAATVQREGGTVVYADYEHALDLDYMKALGLDASSDTFLLMQPDTFEQGMNAVRELIETGEVDMVVVDSVASMVLEKELSIETGGSTFADKAKLMAQAMRQLTPIVKKYDVLMIFLNHLQDVIDSSPMGQRLAAQGMKRTTTPGGRALKYHASLRLEFKQIGNVKTDQVNLITNEKEAVPTQTKVLVKVEKNKVGPPFRSAEVRVRFGQGFSQAWSVQQILTDHGVFKKGAGGVYTFPVAVVSPGDTGDGVPTSVRGEDNLVLALESDPDWLGRCLNKAEELLRGE